VCVCLCVCRFAGFYGSEEGRSCAAFEVGVRSTLDVLRVVKRYYETDFARKVEDAPWDIRHNLPVIYNAGIINGTWRACSVEGMMKGEAMNSSGEVAMNFWDLSLDQSTWTPFLFHSFLDAVDYYAPWTQEAAACFFTFKTSGEGRLPEGQWTMGNLLKDALVCEFDNVMFCGRRSPTGSSNASRIRKNLFVCLMISFFIWYATALIISYIPGAGGLYVIIYSWMWLLVPATALYISYGISVTCYPMIPTCLVEDVVVTFQMILPVEMKWPSALQVYPGCIDRVTNLTNSSVEAASACLRSCRGDPFYFYAWEHSVAWMLCSFDPVTCKDVDFPYAPLVREASWNYSSIHVNAAVKNETATDMWHAHQYCFFMTLAQAFPWLLLGIVGIYILAAMLLLPFPLLSATVQFVVQAVCFTHAD